MIQYSYISKDTYKCFDTNIFTITVVVFYSSFEPKNKSEIKCLSNLWVFHYVFWKLSVLPSYKSVNSFYAKIIFCRSSFLGLKTLRGPPGSEVDLDIY